MKNIALPETDDKLSPHFGESEYFIIYHIKKLSVIQQSKLSVPQSFQGSLVDWLAGQKVTDVIANGIQHKTIEIFNQYKINAFVGAEIKKPEELIMDYLKGVLKTNGNLCCQ